MFRILTAQRPARHEWTRIRGMEARRQGFLRYPYDAVLIGKGPEIDAIDWSKEDPDIPRMGINEAALLVPGVSYAVASDVGAVQRVGEALRKRKQPVVFFPQWIPEQPVKLRGGRVIYWQRDMLRVHARRLGLMLIWRMPDGYRDANERENERERDYQKRQQEKAQ